MTEITFHDFLTWEAVATDAFLVRGAYVKAAGSFKAGALLGRIVYYYLPGKNGNDKLRVQKDGHFWIAKNRQEWQDEIFLTGKELDKALKQLASKDLIDKKVYHFAGTPTMHVRLKIEPFLTVLAGELAAHSQRIAQAYIPERGKSKLPKGEKQYLYTGIVYNNIYIPEKPETETATGTEPDKGPRCPECGSTKVVLAEHDKKGRCAYCLLRAGFAHYFPNKGQPRLGTKKYRDHAETRWREQHFRDNWRQALATASKSPTCRNESWFTFEFFVRNAENYQKMLDDWMAWRDQIEREKMIKSPEMEGKGQI